MNKIFAPVSDSAPADLPPRVVDTLSRLCCGRDHQVGLGHRGLESIAVVHVLLEEDHVAQSHLDDLAGHVKFKRFDSAPSLFVVGLNPHTISRRTGIGPNFPGTFVMIAPHHYLGYSRLALLRSFPDATVLCRGVPMDYGYSHQIFMADTWHEEPSFCDMVFEQARAIATHGRANLIAYPDDVRALAETI